MIPLVVLEEITGAAGVAPRIEALLAIGMRGRQLLPRTLLGIMITLADHRPAHLLTYRQTEQTSGLITDSLGKDDPDGLPSALLQDICDALLEASLPRDLKNASTSLAVDWTNGNGNARTKR